MVSFPNSLAGDYGFDPLGLGEDPESLRWYVQAELVHSRFAMLGVAGILLTDVSISKPLRILLNQSFMVYLSFWPENSTLVFYMLHSLPELNRSAFIFFPFFPKEQCFVLV